MDDPATDEALAAIRDRLGRAEEHIETIKGQLLAYYNSHPCEVAGEFHPEDEGPGTVDWEMRLAPLDPRLNTVVGEFLHDLRSSLDHLAWELVEHDGGGANKHTCFPILEVRPTANKQGQHPPPFVYGGVSGPASTLIDEAQPYQWEEPRDHPLWALNKLWNIDKHRHVVAEGSRTNTTFVGRPPRFKFRGEQTAATEYQATLSLIPEDASVNVNAQTIVEVSIHEPDEGIEAPLLKTLETLHEAVRVLILEAENRCF